MSPEASRLGALGSLQLKNCRDGLTFSPWEIHSGIRPSFATAIPPLGSWCTARPIGGLGALTQSLCIWADLPLESCHFLSWTRLRAVRDPQAKPAVAAGLTSYDWLALMQTPAVAVSLTYLAHSAPILPKLRDGLDPEVSRTLTMLLDVRVRPGSRVTFSGFSCFKCR